MQPDTQVLTLESLTTAQDREPLQTGVVETMIEDGKVALVRLDSVLIEATIAVGCLIRPLPEDRVLVFVAESEAYVLNVLDRVGPNYATIALPGRGSLAIEAENIAVNARQRVSIGGNALDLKAKTLNIVANGANWIGKQLAIVAERLQMSAKSQETSADIIVTKATDRVTVVDRADSLKAGTHTIEVATVSMESAESKVIAAAQDLRMDGKRVTVG